MIDLSARLSQIVMILAIVTINAVLIRWSYRIGDKAWRDQFSLKRKGEGSGNAPSGQLADQSVNGFLACGLITVVFSSRWFALHHVDVYRAIGLLTLYGAILFICHWYAANVIKKEYLNDPGMKQLLRKGYRPYAFYSANLYFFAFLGAALVVHNFVHEVDLFFTESQVFLDSLTRMAGSANAVLDTGTAVALEQHYSRYIVINRGVIQQLEPVVLFCGYIMVVLLVVGATPLRNAFYKDAKYIGYLVTALALVTIASTSLSAYYFQYQDLSASFQTTLQQVIHFQAEDAQLTGRVTEIFEQTTKFTGLSGFLKIFTEEGGIYIIGIAAAQLTASIIARDSRETAE